MVDQRCYEDASGSNIGSRTLVLLIWAFRAQDLLGHGGFPQPSAKRLVWTLCNLEWREKFQEGCVPHLLQAGSDHSPLLIATGGFTRAERSSKPFRFLAAWATHDQFETVVKDTWAPNLPLVPKLDNLAKTLTTWNKEVFGNQFIS